jgi:uncharacterized protein YkwD
MSVCIALKKIFRFAVSTSATDYWSTSLKPTLGILIGGFLKYASLDFPALRFCAVAFLGAVLMAGCGGGGSDSSATNNNNPAPPSSSQAAALLQPSANVQTVTATGDATADGIAFTNAVRQNVGYVTPLTIDTALTTASKNHTVYLVDNQATGHNETSGLPGYTGSSPFVRAPSASGEVVVAGDPLSFSTTLTPVESIFDAPYHRTLMLANFTSMGVASTTGASWEAFNIDFGGSNSAVSESQLVAYPYPGQTDVAVQWFDSEEPDPFASQPQFESTFVGYPITVQGITLSKLSSVSIVLTDSGGNNVTCKLNTADNDTNLTNAAMCIPFAPLKPGAIYSVHLTGVLTSFIGQAHPVDLTWSFTTSQTVAAKAMRLVPQQNHLPQF